MAQQALVVDPGDVTAVGGGGPQPLVVDPGDVTAVAATPAKKTPTYAEAKTPAERKAALRQTPVGQDLFEGGRSAVRGAVKTVQGFAAPVRRAFGMQPATPPQEETTTAGKVGRGVEQAAEFFVPAGLATEIAKLVKIPAAATRAARFGPLLAKYGRPAVEAALQAVGAGTLAKAQGDPHAGRAAVAAATMPLAGRAIADLAPALGRGAQRGVEKILRSGMSTKKLDAPEVPRVVAQAAFDALDLGLKKTWKAWRNITLGDRKATGQALEQLLASPAGSEVIPTQAVHATLDDLLERISKRVNFLDEDGKSLTGEPLRRALEALRSGHTTVDVANIVERDMNHPLVAAVHKLKAQLPDYMYARDLVTLKRQWDAAVFGRSEAGEPVVFLNDRLVAVSKLAANTAANSLRDLFEAAAPSIAEANNLVSRSIKLNQLVKNAARAATGGGTTARRLTQMAGRSVVGGIFGEEYGRGGGFGPNLTGAKGGALGFILGASGLRVLDAAMRSPGWKLFPAMSKAALAQAIVDGKTDRALRLIAPLVTRTAAGAPEASATTPPTATATGTPPQ